MNLGELCGTAEGGPLTKALFFAACWELDPALRPGLLCVGPPALKDSHICTEMP